MNGARQTSTQVVEQHGSREREVWLTLAIALVMSLALHGTVTAALGWIDEQRDPSGHLPEQASRYLLDPLRLPVWEDRWGPVARPLTWSHAMALLLSTAL